MNKLKITGNGFAAAMDTDTGKLLAVEAGADFDNYTEALSVFQQVLTTGRGLGLPYIWARGDTATYFKLAVLSGHGVRIFLRNKEVRDLERMYVAHADRATGIFGNPCSAPNRDRFEPFWAVWPLTEQGLLPFLWAVTDEDGFITELSPAEIDGSRIVFDAQPVDLQQWRLRIVGKNIVRSRR